MNRANWLVAASLPLPAVAAVLVSSIVYGLPDWTDARGGEKIACAASAMGVHAVSVHTLLRGTIARDATALVLAARAAMRTWLGCSLAAIPVSFALGAGATVAVGMALLVFVAWAPLLAIPLILLQWALFAAVRPARAAA